MAETCSSEMNSPSTVPKQSMYQNEKNPVHIPGKLGYRVKLFITSPLKAPGHFVVLKKAPDKELVANVKSENLASDEKSSCDSTNNKPAHSEAENNKLPTPSYKSGKHLCLECGATLSTRSNLKKHVRKKHPDKLSVLVTSSKNFKFKCNLCHRRYNDNGNLRYHEKTVHNIIRQKKLHKCSLCVREFERQDMNKHLVTDHNIVLKSDNFLFNSYDEFVSWKSNIEKTTRSSFIKESSRVRGSIRYHYFICHRSGTFISESCGKRKLKFQGSNKINAFCPAIMKVSVVKGKDCAVTFQSQHVGHRGELNHLNLTHEERKYLASKLAADVPLDTILDDVHKTISSDEFHRLHLLTKKDLYNIRSSFGIDSSAKNHQNNSANIQSWVEEFQNDLNENSCNDPEDGNLKFNMNDEDCYSEISMDAEDMESQNQIPDHSSSISLETRNKLIEKFASVVNSATIEEFKLLENIVSSLTQSFSAHKKCS